MSDQDNKVISMWNREVKKEEDQQSQSTYSFEEIEKKNKERKEKLAKERANANKSVLRSYNIKG